MKNLISFISFTIAKVAALGAITTGGALAHPGHVTMEQAHSFLHAEHLLILAGVVGIIVINVIIRKRF